MSEKLLNESTVRRFMKLANLSPISNNFLKEEETKEELEDLTPKRIAAGVPLDDTNDMHRAHIARIVGAGGKKGKPYAQMLDPARAAYDTYWHKNHLKWTHGADRLKEEKKKKPIPGTEKTKGKKKSQNESAFNANYILQETLKRVILNIKGSK